MKIVRLYLQNLASLEGPFELDFTRPPLVNAGVFAITGQTGAGKSTLLDAICLALYGTTPRYHTSKDKKVTVMDGSGDYLTNTDVRGILKRGTVFGQAQVDFIGIDHRRYRATWSVKRAHNQTSGNLQPSKNRVESLEDNAIQLDRTTEALDKIEQLVGLNFEQFTRSVLLAQGDFTAFLKAEKKDKAALLEKLSGTYEYSEISKRVYERHKLEKSTLDLLKDRLQSVQLMTEAEVVEVDEHLKEINSALSNLSQQEATINQGLQWHQQFQLFQVEVSNAQHALEETEKQWQSQAIDLQRLDLVMHARPALIDMRIYRETDARINARELTIHELESTLSNLNIRHTQLNEELRNSIYHQVQRAVELEAAAPIIDQGKLLEHQYQELDQKHSALKEVLPNFEQKERTAAKLLLDINQMLKQQKARVESLETWIKQHEQQRILAEQLPLLQSHLEEVKQIREQGLAIRAALDRENRVKADLESKYQDQKLSLETKRQQLNQLYQQQKELEEQLHQYQPTNLQELLSKTKTALLKWEQLLANWSIHQQSKITLETLQSEERQVEYEMGLKKKTKIDLEILLQRKSDELTGADLLLQRARIVASENVENLRSILQQGEACLVCGSLDHPYRKHQPYSDFILQEMEYSKKQLEEEQKKLSLEVGALQQSIFQLEQKTREYTEWIPKQSNKVLELENNLSAHPYYKNLEDVIELDRATWIQQQLQQVTVEHQNTDRDLSSYQKTLVALNLIRKQVQTLSEDTNQQNNQLAEVHLQVQGAELRVTQIEQERQRLLNAMESIRISIGAFLNLPDWEATFRTNPEVLADEIRQEVNQWQTAFREHQELSVQLAKSSSDQLLLEQDWKLHTTKLQEKLVELETVTTAQKSILDELKILLGGLSSSEKKEILQKALKESQVQTERIQVNFSSLEKEIEARKSETARLIKENQTEIISRTNLKSSLDAWLHAQRASYNWDLLIQFSQLPEEQIENDRKKAESLKQKRAELQTIVSERNRALLLHQNRKSTSLDQPQLESALQKIQGEQASLHEQGTNLRTKRAQDQLNRANHEDLTQQILEQELLTDRWAKLNTVIGSADGASFRNIAQQYTLDQLLSYAKIHLQQLSNRYELQRIPNEVAIQVVDKDMGDEIRSVNSLSGGETFLVSLALALGLASLSAQQINVESLFIDEGFGSLDPQTLNIAMDALEQLQNQGRKVGVISHVQEMTERIPVQIQVVKKQGGTSLIHIPK